MKVSRLSCLVRSTIAHASQRRFVLGPPAADLDPDLQIDLAAEKPLHVETRGGRDSLQLAPARSDDDRLVSLSSHHDGGVNPPHAALVLEFLDFHAGAVGKLRAQKAKQLFAQEFRGEKPLVAVGQGVLGMDRGLLGQVALQRAQELVEPLAATGADRHDFLELCFARHLFQEREQIRGCGRVDLVHDQKQRNAHGDLNKIDRKSTRLNSSHANISYAVFCLKKKNTNGTLYI